MKGMQIIKREGGFCKVEEGRSVPLLGHLAGHGRERERERERGINEGVGGSVWRGKSWNFGKDWNFGKLENLVVVEEGRK